MTNHKVLVKINKGFGSHTIMNEFVDDAGDKVQRGVLHRNIDKEPFELPISDYNLFKEKYALCDPNTGKEITPVVPIVQNNMADKLQAAGKKTAGRKQPVKA